MAAYVRLAPGAVVFEMAWRLVGRRNEIDLHLAYKQKPVGDKRLAKLLILFVIGASVIPA